VKGNTQTTYTSTYYNGLSPYFSGIAGTNSYNFPDSSFNTSVYKVYNNNILTITSRNGNDAYQKFEGSYAGGGNGGSTYGSTYYYPTPGCVAVYLTSQNNIYNGT
jgi:hypothetical protein